MPMASSGHRIFATSSPKVLRSAPRRKVKSRSVTVSGDGSGDDAQYGYHSVLTNFSARSLSTSPVSPSTTAVFGGMASPGSAQVDLPTSESELTRDPQERKAYKLLRLQAFDGSFPSGSGEWATELIKAFDEWNQQQEQGLETATLGALPREVLEKLVASAVAAAIFEVELKDSQGVWEMVVEKTDGWGVQTAGETAWNAVKTWASQQVVMAGELKTENFWAK
ncbi:hypothetical protein Mapa_003109 [Marchantia paleacea]|nr:hypothetical protein Mapa_003109 [Marchantia paleacea]